MFTALDGEGRVRICHCSPTQAVHVGLAPTTVGFRAQYEPCNTQTKANPDYLPVLSVHAQALRVSRSRNADGRVDAWNALESVGPPEGNVDKGGTEIGGSQIVYEELGRAPAHFWVPAEAPAGEVGVSAWISREVRKKEATAPK